jgi:glycosyltransferase involved in cell wall biosynthesis
LGRGADRLICAHVHHLPVAWLARRLNGRLRYYLVAHGIEVWRPYSRLERRALLGAERIFCVSEYTRRQLLRFCPDLHPGRLLVVPNTLDPTFVAQPASPPAFAGPRILCVTRLTASDSYKGVDTLIEVLPQLRRDFPLVRLRIVGQGDDLPRLTALAERLGVAASVDFLGPIPDEALRAEYAGCDFFALPSRREGFGLVYLEAMTYGKACLAARAGGAPEVVNDEVGCLADYANLADLAAGLADLARHPRDSGVVRRHADSFAFPAFARRLTDALA